MDYDAIAAIFLTPPDSPVPSPIVPDTPARRLRDAVEPIATIGWWSRAAADAVTSLGHGFFDGYVWGRAASLGADVSESVVTSAFGVFNGALLGPVYSHGRSVSTRADILRAREVGATTGLRDATVGVDVEIVTSAGRRLHEAVASLEPGARHLFGALQALPVPDDPHGRLWRAAELVREHRGDTHLAACVAAGLTMAEMNVFTEVWLGYPVGEYSSTRGFDADALAVAVAGLVARGWLVDGALTATGRAARDRLEEVTDAGQRQLVEALGSDVDELITQLSVIGEVVVASRAAPADPRKRAAG